MNSTCGSRNGAEGYSDLCTKADLRVPHTNTHLNSAVVICLRYGNTEILNPHKCTWEQQQHILHVVDTFQNNNWKCNAVDCLSVCNSAGL